MGTGIFRDELEQTGLTKKENNLRSQIKAQQNEYTRIYEASPIFPFSNATLTAGSTEVFDLHNRNTGSEKYGTFTNLRIANNSAVNILLNPSQNTARAVLIPSGTVVELDRNALGGGFTSWSITNASGSSSATAGDIKMEAYKVGVTSDQLIKQAHRTFFRAIGLGMNRGAK